MFTIDGLVSGLDTSSIIENLVAIQENQINRLTARKDLILAEQTAFQGIEAGIISLRSSMSRLNRTTSSVFDQRVAVSSDEDALTAVANSNALEGTYQLQINSLAKAHQLDPMDSKAHRPPSRRDPFHSASVIAPKPP